MIRKVEAAASGRAKFKRGMSKLMGAIRFRRMGARAGIRRAQFASFAARERAYTRARRRGQIY